MATPQGNTGFISEMDIRIWIRDHDPEANLLIKDYEFGEEELRAACTLVVDAWNEEPPNMHQANYTLYSFPFRYNMLMGVAAQLLFMAANRFRRNAIQMNVPGGGISDQDKHAQYEQAAVRLWQGFLEWTRRKKREINMLRGWGSI